MKRAVPRVAVAGGSSPVAPGVRVAAWTVPLPATEVVLGLRRVRRP